MRDKAPPMRVVPARQVAYRAIMHQVRKYPDLELSGVDTTRLEGRDAALAHAIYDAVLRRWLTLQHILEGLLGREWDLIDPRIRAALLCGSAQLLLMDRLPAHAVVADSVEWVKAQAGPRAGGMVNAVLRRVDELIFRDSAAATAEAEAAAEEIDLDVAMRASLKPGPPPALPSDARGRRERWTDRRDEIPLADGSALALREQVLPADADRRLSIATSHPLELIRSWLKTIDRREVRRLALHGIAAPTTIVNTANATAELPMAGEGVDGFVAHAAPGHHAWTGSHEALGALMRERSDIWVQDPASSLAVQSVADMKPQVVLDLCAGLGTKTRQLAAAFPEAQIIATDKDRGRFEKLKALFAGHPRVRVVEWPKDGPTGLAMEFAGGIDMVLLDVPCSNSGVLARRVEARYRFDARRTEELAAMQRQLIADSIPLLRRGPGSMSGGGGGGMIVYSTCSLDPTENEEQARWAARWHGLEVGRERRRAPEGGPGEPIERYSDGSYAVVLS